MKTECMETYIHLRSKEFRFYEDIGLSITNKLANQFASFILVVNLINLTTFKTHAPNEKKILERKFFLGV